MVLRAEAALCLRTRCPEPLIASARSGVTLSVSVCALFVGYTSERASHAFA
jgi:hypothetical protein